MLLQDQYPDEEIEVGLRFTLEPCVGLDHIHAIFESTDGEQVCPRVELSSDNIVAAKLAPLFAHPRNGVHAKDLLDVFMPPEEYSTEERTRVFMRAMNGGDTLSNLMTEKAKAKAEAERKH